MSSVRLRRAGAALGAVVALLPTAAAYADAASDAEALFARGKERLAAGDHAEACPLLAESQRLDPATGTLLALAVCHEREGKLASAFAEYGEVAARARDERRKDREAVARERAAALEGRLSRLTIGGAQLAGLAAEVRLDGELLARAQLDTPLPLDGGFRRITVSAEGKQPWSTDVTLAESGDAITVAIPLLEALTPVASGERDALPFLYTPASEPAPRSELAPRERDGRRSAAEWTGIGVMASGALSLTIATGYLARAIHKHNVAEVACEGQGCEAAAQENRLAAERATDGAAVSAIVGLGLSAGGLITYLIGRHHRPAPRAVRCTTAGVWAASNAFGAALGGSFR